MSFSIFKQHTSMLPVRLGTVAIRNLATKPGSPTRHNRQTAQPTPKLPFDQHPHRGY